MMARNKNNWTNPKPLVWLLLFGAILISGCATHNKLPAEISTSEHSAESAEIEQLEGAPSTEVVETSGETDITMIETEVSEDDESFYDDEEDDDKDPLEKFNRAVFKFNRGLDKAILRPVARGYVKVMPRPIRTGVSNFFSNLREPTTIINDLLQGKFRQGGRDAARFVVNTTAGIGGIFDVAQHLNLDRNREDFGQTFAKWGIPAGPYLMLPFLGPSNVRDTVGTLPEYLYTDPIYQIDDSGTQWGFVIARFIDTRADLLSIDNLLEQQLDPYIFVRESYRQRREDLIYDGDPPLDDEWDDLLDEE